MHKEILSAIAIILTLIAFLPYIRSIRQGKTKPHVFSWIIWGLTTFIVSFAQLADKGGAGAWPIGLSGLITMYVALLAYQKKSDITITRTDWLFFILALTSLPLWYFTSNPLWAVIILTSVDLMGFVPTFRKAYFHPFEEQLGLFIIMTIRNLIAIAALENYSLTTLLFPLAIAIASTLFIWMVLSKRSSLIIPMVCYLLFTHPALAVAPPPLMQGEKCIPPTDRGTLQTLTGHYVLSSIIPRVKESGLFTGSIPGNVPAHTITISKEGEVSFGLHWHEGWSWEEIKERSDKDCLKRVDKDTITFHNQQDAPHYTLLKGYQGELVNDHNFFFTMLFNGCYVDPEKQKICFNDEKVYFNGKWHKALLHMDGSELPPPSEGNVLEIEGGKFFWLLKPIGKNQEHGKIIYHWQLRETYWVTDPEYEKIDPHKSRTLIPMHYQSNTRSAR